MTLFSIDDYLTRYEHLGDLSATPPWHSRHMTCEPCRVSWTGCWDNFQCPRCAKGELPTHDGSAGGMIENKPAIARRAEREDQ
jgi:hypothetical protein